MVQPIRNVSDHGKKHWIGSIKCAGESLICEPPLGNLNYNWSRQCNGKRWFGSANIMSALCLANNCAIAGTFRGIQEDFYRIYRRKAHVHHYTEFMEQSRFEEANESVCNLIELYEQLDSSVSYNSAGGIFATKTSTSEQVRPQLFRRTGPVVGVWIKKQENCLLFK